MSLQYRPEKVHRIILKISGEFLAGDKKFGIHHPTLETIANELVAVKRLGFSLGIVLGGGNFFRGVSGCKDGVSRVTGDSIGMLATIQNSLVLSDYLSRKNYNTEIFSAVQLDRFTKFYAPERAERAFEEGKICFFCAGTGNPFFTTDTAAVLRAIETNAHLVMKGTKVNGVYSDDPVKNDKAVYYDQISYREVISKNLKVMDLTAFSLAKENKIPIKVFNIKKPNNFKKAILNVDEGTYISEK